MWSQAGLASGPPRLWQGHGGDCSEAEGLRGGPGTSTCCHTPAGDVSGRLGQAQAPRAGEDPPCAWARQLPLSLRPCRVTFLPWKVPPSLSEVPRIIPGGVRGDSRWELCDRPAPTPRSRTSPLGKVRSRGRFTLPVTLRAVPGQRVRALGSARPPAGPSDSEIRGRARAVTRSRTAGPLGAAARSPAGGLAGRTPEALALGQPLIRGGVRVSRPGCWSSSQSGGRWSELTADEEPRGRKAALGRPLHGALFQGPEAANPASPPSDTSPLPLPHQQPILNA